MREKVLAILSDFPISATCMRADFLRNDLDQDNPLDEFLGNPMTSRSWGHLRAPNPEEALRHL